MAHVYPAFPKGRGRNPAHPDQEPRLDDLDQAIDEDLAGGDLPPRRTTIGQCLPRLMRVGGDRVPEDHPPLRAELVEDAVDDGARRFFPRSLAPARSPVGTIPAKQVEFAGEGNPRPAHALVAGGLTDRDDVGSGALVEIAAKIRYPDQRRIRQVVWSGITELVEGGADGCPGEVGEQGADRALVTIGQWS